jgi:serine/threonine protein kinase
MGAVYVAAHERLETRKVIKILLPMYARHAMLRERFEREALAVSRLRHKHIVTIDDYGQLADGQLFLMMPFLEGRPLDAYLRAQRKFTEHRALHILLQVCVALQHMHDAAIVHRDIKPSNIFIVTDDDNPYRVVLIDLGIAKSLSDRDLVTSSGSVMGTPAYMAVEQYEDSASVTPLADLYAVAIVAWELVTGALPWGMHSPNVLYQKQKQECPVRPSGMSADWYTILLGALSVHPYDRPQSMRAFAVALASVVPAIPPYVPSGAEMLAKLAKHFVEHTPPEDETVRNGSHPDRVAPMLWPPRETQVPALAAGGLPPLDVHTVSAHAGQAPTTLTASTGVAEVPPGPERRVATRRYWAAVMALVLSVAALGVVGTYSIVRRGEDETRPASAPSPSTISSDVPSPPTLSSDVPSSDTPSTTPAVDAPPPPLPPPDALIPDAEAAAVATDAAAPTAPRRSPEIRPPVLKKGPGSPRSAVEAVPASRDRGSSRQRDSDPTYDKNAAGGDE